MTATNQISKIRGRRSRQSGVALITTLLLLLLMTALSLAMVISVRSDLLVNGYYRNTRGAFYAADSGINISRQAMINGVVGSLPAVGAAGVSPLAVDALSNVTISPAVLTAVQTSYSGNTSLTGSGKGIAPKFLAGYNLGAPKVPLPTGSFNQKTAVLDGIGKGGSNPTAAQMAAALKNAG